LPHADKASLFRLKRQFTALMQDDEPLYAHAWHYCPRPRPTHATEAAGIMLLLLCRSLLAPRGRQSSHRSLCEAVGWYRASHAWHASFLASEGDVSRTTSHQAWAARRPVNPRGYRAVKSIWYHPINLTTQKSSHLQHQTRGLWRLYYSYCRSSQPALNTPTMAAESQPHAGRHHQDLQVLIVASLPARQPQEWAKSAHGSLRTDLIGHLDRSTPIHPCNDIATIMEDPQELI